MVLKYNYKINLTRNERVDIITNFTKIRKMKVFNNIAIS